VMPGGMDGVQLAEAARKLRPDLKILLTTGYDREALRSRNIDTGIPILKKPYLSQDLLDSISKCLQPG
jgi:CheY-like chemotaxis protein